MFAAEQAEMGVDVGVAVVDEVDVAVLVLDAAAIVRAPADDGVDDGLTQVSKILITNKDIHHTYTP